MTPLTYSPATGSCTLTDDLNTLFPSSPACRVSLAPVVTDDRLPAAAPAPRARTPRPMAPLPDPANWTKYADAGLCPAGNCNMHPSFHAHDHLWAGVPASVWIKAASLGKRPARARPVKRPPRASAGISGRQYLDPGDKWSGRYDPPRACTVRTQWARPGTPPAAGIEWRGRQLAKAGPRNVAVTYGDGSVAVIPFLRRLRKPAQ